MFTRSILRRTFRCSLPCYCPVVDQEAVRLKLKTKDLSLQVPSKDGLVRFTYVQNRQSLTETIVRHGLWPLQSDSPHQKSVVETWYYNLHLAGSILSFINLQAAPLEGEQRVELRYAREDIYNPQATELEHFFFMQCEALGLGECRARVRCGETDLMNYLEEGACISKDTLDILLQHTQSVKVDQVLYNQKKKFTSLVSRSCGELIQSASTTESGNHLSLDLFPSAEACEAAFATGDPQHKNATAQEMEKQLKMYYNYFYNNIALLGYGSLYASDGVSSVLWCPTAIAQTQKEWSADTLTAEALKEACIPYSFGLRVTPMAAGAQKEKEVRQIQVALTQATAQLLYSPQPSRSPLYPLLGEDTVSHASLCQTVLSLVSGDYEGALAAAMKARTVVEVDLESVRRQIHPVRVALGIDAIVLPLDGASAARTGIDFFCRCTRQEILNSLITAPQAVIEDLRKAHEAVAAGTAQEEGLVCASCKKRHIIRTEDFVKLDEVRKAATAEKGSNPEEKES